MLVLRSIPIIRLPPPPP
ncbi:hypothetical protein YPPY59_1840, partial [Yersinia pestis PY-59]